MKKEVVLARASACGIPDKFGKRLDGLRFASMWAVAFGIVDQDGEPVEFGNGCAQRVGSGSCSVTLWLP